MVSDIVTLPAVGQLLGAAFDRALAIFAARWRLLLVIAALAIVGGFVNVTIGLAVLWCFTLYWFYASLANTVRVANPAYKMDAVVVARLIGLGIIYGLVVEIGLFLVIIPGVYVGTRWSLAQLIAVKESKGVSDSLSRSWALTESVFWPTLWFNICAALAVAAVSIGGYLIAGAFIAFMPGLGFFRAGSSWSGGGFSAALLTIFLTIYLYAIAYTYQAKDLALLYWYEALAKRQAPASP